MYQLVNVGSAPNDGTGDNLRTAFIKLNADVVDIYTKPFQRPENYAASMNGIGDDYNALNALIAAAAGTSTPVVIDGPMLIGTNITTPVNIQLLFVGTGMFKPAAGITITINGPIVAGAWQIFDLSNSGALITGLPDITSCFTEWFGALADDTVDCTVPFQRTAKFALDAGCIDIQLLAGTYKTTATVYANGSNNLLQNSPNWFGRGRDNTTIDYSTIASGLACFKMRGGSGHNSGAIIDGIQFIGNSTSIGIMFSGVNSFRARNCRFTTNAIGIQFHNEDTGSFTEFCYGDNCQFTSACIRAINYKVTSGNPSHHGSGLVNGCLIGVGASDVVLIDSNAQPYQSALDVIVFPTGNANLINCNRSAAPIPDFVGSIKVELGGNTLVLGATNTVDFQGPIGVVGLANTTGAGMTSGTFRRIKNKALYANSSSTVTGFEAAQTISNLNTPSVQIPSLIGGNSRNYTVRVFGANYDYRYHIYVEPNGFGGAGTAFLQNDRAVYALDTAVWAMGNDSITFAAPFAGTETSGTLSNPWPLPTGTYLLVFSNGSTRPAAITFGGTAVTWSVALTVASSATVLAVGYGNPFTVNTSGQLFVNNAVALTFTGTFAGTETSGTLSDTWSRATGVYNLTFSSGEIRAVTLTKTLTTATWSTPLTLSATASSTACGWPTTGVTLYAYEMEISGGVLGGNQILY